MASFKLNKRGKFRIRFTLDGKEKEMQLPTADKKVAETISGMVERLIEKRQTGEPDRILSNWLKDIPDDLRQRLERAGLVEVQRRLTIEQAANAYIESKKESWKGLTRIRRERENSWFLKYFKPETRLEAVDRKSAVNFMNWLKSQKELTSPLYINKIMKWATSVFKYAILCGDFSLANPFQGVRLPNVVMRDKCYISIEFTEKLIEKCPTVQWRTLVALLRFGGLRPEEALLAEWNGIDWEAGTFTFRSPKTEHHPGKERRSIPLFPRLRQALEEMRMAAEIEGGIVLPKYILSSEKRGNGWDSKRSAIQNDRGVSLCELSKYIKKAELINPGSVPTNMRGSCSTDLKRKYPEYAVDSWLGHAKEVANKHYDVVTQDLFEQAASSDDFPVSRNVPGNVPGIVPGQVGILDNLGLQAGGKPIPQAPEIQGFLQETKKPCYDKQGGNLPPREVNPYCEKPLFCRGLGDSANGLSPELSPDCDKIELILSLIDSLTFEEKESLFDRLEAVEC